MQFTTNGFVRLMLLVALPAACGPGCCWCPGHGCLRDPVEQQQPVVGYHHHPPFHPVPTRPVFTPKTDAYAAVSPCMITPDGQVPLLVPPGVGAPQIELILPESAPEEVPTPSGEPSREDRLTGRPRTPEPSSRPATVANRPGWIFTPAPAGDLNIR